MEHFKEGQYDDDLTQGSYDDDLTADIEEYDEDFDTGEVDLFGYTDDEDSVLGRLKSIILSIEWEITDDILLQFNEELLDLKNIWAGNKINLIYVQALEKISRYIYKEKSSAHPNAIKLLLTFYTNLEKIVSDETISELQQKKMLRDDINLFEKLKKQIGGSAAPAVSAKEQEASLSTDHSAPQPAPVSSDALIDDSAVELGEPGQEDPLLNLKAIVYGIDWEITERDLKNLSNEVKRLELQYNDSKAKKIFLQGIGSLGAYINLKRSDAHADAFKLLHSFFIGLETVVRNNLSGQAEKDVLLPEVEKFNGFKRLIADTITPKKTSTKIDADNELEVKQDETEIRPAFADVPDDVRGFRADGERDTSTTDTDINVAEEYGVDDEFTKQTSDADSALASEMESRLEGMFDEPSEDAVHQLDKNMALQGVDVETEDDDESDEEPLPEYDGELAPALDTEDVYQREESPVAIAGKEETSAEVEEDSQPVEPTLAKGDIPGLDVEHEADDESEEEPLPFDGDEIAPALSSDDTEVSERRDEVSEVPSDIDNRLDDFFGESVDRESGESEVDSERESVHDLHKEQDLKDPEVYETDLQDEDLERTEPTRLDNEIDGRIDDFFKDDDVATGSDESADPIGGIDVETPDDDDSDEDPLPLTGGELAPALSDDEEEERDSESDFAKQAEITGEENEETGLGEIFGNDQLNTNDIEEVVEEDTTESDEPDDVDARFDELFGETNQQEDGEKDREGVQTASFDVEKDEIDRDQAFDGVNVETADDDDSKEAPLPLVDGELAPAFSDQGEPDLPLDSMISDESDEDETEKRFDDLFDVAQEDQGSLETQEEEHLVDEQTQADTATEDPLLGNESPIQEEQIASGQVEALADEGSDYEEAGFEEILDEEIEEIPEELLAGADTITTEGEQEKEEILAYFADEDTDDSEEEIPEMEADDLATVVEDSDSSNVEAVSSGYATPDELLSQFDDEDVKHVNDSNGVAEVDDNIPEMEVDDLATIINEGSGISTAGDVPTGYPSTDELLRQFGEVAGEKQAVDDSVDEEEVVFEAVDESEEQHTAYQRGDEQDETFGITILDDGEYAGRIGAEGEKEPESEVESEDIFAEEGETALADSDSVPSAYRQPQGDVSVQEGLAGMRSCIASLGLEIDSTILDSMNVEIEKLRHAWLDRPAEKTFVQLLSTIVGHISKYRYDADQEANKLLLSVFDKLELTATGQAEGPEIQEALLNETSKVLHWQARLIDRVPATNGFEEKTMEPIQNQGLSTETVIEEYTHLEDMSRQVDEIGDDMLMQKVSTVMKTELDQLKAAFQSELMELRKEIQRGGSDKL